MKGSGNALDGLVRGRDPRYAEFSALSLVGQNPNRKDASYAFEIKTRRLVTEIPVHLVHPILK